MVYFAGKKFHEFYVLEKIIHRKQKIYMVHTLFLTDSQNLNPTKYTHLYGTKRSKSQKSEVTFTKFYVQLYMYISSTPICMKKIQFLFQNDALGLEE